jgi:hypothetical protein
MQIFFTNHGWKNHFKIWEISKPNKFKFLPVQYTAQWIWRSSGRTVLSSAVFKPLCELLSVSLPFILWKSASQKAKSTSAPRSPRLPGAAGPVLTPMSPRISALSCSEPWIWQVTVHGAWSEEKPLVESRTLPALSWGSGSQGKVIRWGGRTVLCTKVH